MQITSLTLKLHKTDLEPRPAHLDGIHRLRLPIPNADGRESETLWNRRHLISR